jgi:circadian clock protein KaiB
MTDNDADPPDTDYLLRLFVSGRTQRSARALRNLESLCDDALGGRYRVEVIDVLDDPGAADEDRIIVTPTLLRLLPPPIRRVIGDLSDRESVLVGLDLLPAGTAGPRS